MILNTKEGWYLFSIDIIKQKENLCQPTLRPNFLRLCIELLRFNHNKYQCWNHETFEIGKTHLNSISTYTFWALMITLRRKMTNAIFLVRVLWKLCFLNLVPEMNLLFRNCFPFFSLVSICLQHPFPCSIIIRLYCFPCGLWPFKTEWITQEFLVIRNSVLRWT